MTAKVANEPEVSVGLKVPIERLTAAFGTGPQERLRGGEVVVDAGDRLHQPTVAMAEAQAIDGFCLRNVRRSVATDRDLLVRTEDAWHAARPEQLVVEIVVHVAVDVLELGEARLGRLMHCGDQLELRFAEVGCDQRVGKRRAERRRVWARRQHALGCHP